MATTSDSPDNNIESRKKRTGTKLKLKVHKMASALPCEVGHLQGFEMSLDET